MALKGKLYVDGSPKGKDPYTVWEFEYYISRDIQQDGTRDRHSLYVFKVCIVAPDKATFFYDWMLENKTMSGRLELDVDASSKAQFTVVFEDAYCQTIIEQFRSNWENMMVTIMYLCPQKIELLDTFATSGNTSIKKSGITFNNLTGTTGIYQQFPRDNSKKPTILGLND